LSGNLIARAIEAILKVGGIRVGEIEIPAWIRGGGSYIDPTREIGGRLNVVDCGAGSGAGYVKHADELMKHLWGEGSAQMGRLAWSLCGQVEAQTTLEEGLPWDKIVEKSRDFDLLIFGKSRSKTGWRLFSQHTAQRAIENAACPVMV
jgi:hypothetical protein